MQYNVQTRIISFVISSILSVEFVFLLGCESDLTDSLEGRPCAIDYGCLTGYVCDVDANVCIKDTQTEENAITATDGDNRDQDGSTVEPAADATARESDSTTNNNEKDAGSFDAGGIDSALPASEVRAQDSTVDSHFEIDSGGSAGQGGDNDAAEVGGSGGSPDAGGSPDSSGSSDSSGFPDAGGSPDSSGSSDSGGFPDAGGSPDSSGSSDSGSSPDSGGSSDSGSDAFVCGQSIEPTGTVCPDICRSCENKVCLIVCDREKQCDKDTITCPPDFNCSVQCSQKQSCEKSTIECPDENACIVSCTGESACKLTDINCYEGPCELRCDIGDRACDKTVLNCGIQKCEASCGPGQEAPNINDCDLSCSTDCGC